MSEFIIAVKEAAAAVGFARELCKDVVSDMWLMNEAEIEIIAITNPEIHQAMCIIEDLAESMDKLIG